MSDKKSGNYLKGAAILAATVAIVKVLGAVYKIALGNIIGDEGFAHFTVAYNIYNLLLTLSTAGLPIAVSKMISEANALNRRRQIERIFSVSTISFCLLGLVGTMVMLCFPGQLAAGFNDIEAEKSILALCPSIFFVCLMSAYRGYTQGHADMELTSISQVIEVLGKVIFGILLAWLFFKDGLPAASAGAIAGVSIGSVLACLYSAVYITKWKGRRTRSIGREDVPEKPGIILRRLISVAIPVAFGSSVLNLINLIDTKLIMSLLQSKAGFDYYEAKVLFGVFGKAQTLFNMPSSFVLPLAISVIPAISAFAAQRRNREAREAMMTSIKITTLLALPAGAGLCVLARPIMTVLYSGSAPEGVGVMAILGIASYFACLLLITNAILQAFGHEKLPIITVAAGGVLKIIIDFALVGKPEIGIYGAAIGTLFCDALITVLNIYFLRKLVPGARGFTAVFLKPVACTALMAVAAYLGNEIFGRAAAFLFPKSALMAAAAGMTASIAVSAVLYFAAVILTGAITREELFMLPGGPKLAKILKMR